MPTPGDESCCVQALTEVTRDRFSLTFAPGCRCPYPFVILRSGGSALVRRRIQTPSVATVLSVFQPEGEVVLGASPPARRFAKRSGGPVGRKTADRQGPAGLYVDIASDVDAARLIPGNPARFARHDDLSEVGPRSRVRVVSGCGLFGLVGMRSFRVRPDLSGSATVWSVT